MSFILDSINKFIKLTSAEIYSSERHFIYVNETTRPSIREVNGSDSIRIIKRDDKFINSYFKRLSETFLERGEVGLGYYLGGSLVGCLWLRFGEFPEQVGREIVVIPKDYVLLHHLVVDSRYRGKGIGTALLNEFVSTIAFDYRIVNTVAFVNFNNVSSLHVFNSAGFVQQGSVSSRRFFGKRVCTIDSSGIPLGEGSTGEYRSIVARSFDFPIKVLSRPYLYQEENLVDGVIGGRPWLSIFTATVLRDSIPGILHAIPKVGTPILIPCSVSPGKRLGRLRIDIEPTSFQPWPNVNEHNDREIISSIARVCQSPWIDALNWTLPFWIDSNILDLELPANCSLTRIKDPTWIIGTDGRYEEVEKNFSKTARTYMRQAEKRGVEICDKPTIEEIGHFADLWLSSYRSRKWDGFQYNRLFFVAVNKYIDEGARIVLAKVDNKVIGGGVFIQDMLGYVHLLGAVDRNYDYYRPMYVVINHMVKMAVEAGVSYINLGGTGSRKNLEYFKQHWGAQPRDLYRLQYDNSVQRVSTRIGSLDKAYRYFLRYSFRVVCNRFRYMISRG